MQTRAQAIERKIRLWVLQQERRRLEHPRSDVLGRGAAPRPRAGKEQPAARP